MRWSRRLPANSLARSSDCLAMESTPQKTAVAPPATGATRACCGATEATALTAATEETADCCSAMAATGEKGSGAHRAVTAAMPG